MDPRASVDDFQPPWTSFAEFFYSRTDVDADFLTEIDHTQGTRYLWTVGEWRARVTATVSWLQVKGVRQGVAVATIAGNSADALALAYACWVLGACLVPLNPADPVERQSFILGDARAHLLVYGDAHAERAALMAPEGVHACTTRTLPSGAAVESEDVRFVGNVDLNVPAVRIYTSGTTGNPKGVVLSVLNLLTDLDALRVALDWPQDTRVLTVLPVHHVNGLVISSLLPWYAGLSTVLCDRFRSTEFWADVEAENATVCSVVPSLLEFLLQAGGDAPTCFREFLCGAGPLLVETVLQFEARLARPVRHLYGLSETTAVLTLMPRLPVHERTRWHREQGFPAVGPAMPHIEVAVLDAEDRLLPAGVRGELAARGAVVMCEYAGQPQATADAFRAGWFRTGDEGFWQPGPAGEPFFFIAGRIKELIIRGGANVSPYEVDAVLRTHPAVEFALAVPFENRMYGEEIAAYVVARSPIDQEELLAHCARFLDYAHCPKVIIFGDDVPFTATGKAKRLELKRRLAPQLSPYRDVQFRRSAQERPS